MCIFDLRSVTELITELVGSFRLFIFKFNRFQTEFIQGVQLIGFRDAIVVSVLPKAQLRKDSIPLIDDAIRVTAISNSISAKNPFLVTPDSGRG